MGSKRRREKGRVPAKRLERERVALMLPTVWYACLNHLARAGGQTAVALTCEHIKGAWVAAGLDPSDLPAIPKRGRPPAAV